MPTVQNRSGTRRRCRLSRTNRSAGHTWGLPWPCVHEFFAVVDQPKGVSHADTVRGRARQRYAAVLEVGVRLLGESSAHLDVLDRLLTTSRVTGPKVHDARIAAICIGHGVSELWTADRDFSYFPELRIRNPLVHQD